MKKLLFIFVAMAVCLSSAAQNPQSRTTLHVGVVVEKQSIVAGPYARYAQKYLGVTAPLTDKVLYEIRSADISDERELYSTSITVGTAVTSHMNPAGGFPKLPVDKTSNAAQSLEESARLAAAKIFEIRTARYELITGEAGENVFGAGLGDALSELERLEEEHLSLFLGKHTITTAARQYKITPVQGRHNYTVCRFSDTGGLLPGDDLSGVPVVLELKPLDTAQTSDSQAKPSSRAVAQHIAVDVLCRIIFENTELTSTVIPIDQFGRTIYLAQ